MLCLFFFNDTATTEIYTLSLHDALPILATYGGRQRNPVLFAREAWPLLERELSGDEGARVVLKRHPELVTEVDRKSTRLNSSHANISYAVFCLKKKKPNT